MNSVIYSTPDVSSRAARNARIIHERMLSVVLNCRPSSLLEIGAGQGTMGAAFVQCGIDYVGIEPFESEFTKARQRYPALHIIQAPCYDDPEELHDKQFDLVYSNDIIEHLYEPRTLVRFSRSHLRPGGVIVCGTPDYGSYLRNLVLSLSNRWEYHHNPLWDGGHIKFFSKSSLHRIWAEAGFTEFEWGSIRSAHFPLMPMYLYCTARMK